jgi:type I restriction enzyme S subunit
MMPQADNTHALPANLPQLRFPEFKDAGVWEEDKLGSLSDVRDGTHDSPKFHSTGKALITSKNLCSDGSLDAENVSYISEEDYEQINRRSKVDIGDILFGMIGTIGNPVMVRTDGFAIKNVALIKQQEQLLNSFLVQMLSSHYIANKLQVLNTGNSQKFIALGKLRNLDIHVPCIEEQQKIAACLTSLDDLITTENQQLEALKTHKKGLMQSLFPNSPPLEGWQAQPDGVVSPVSQQPDGVVSDGQTTPRLRRTPPTEGNLPQLRFPEFKDAGAWVIGVFNDAVSIIDGDRGVNYPKAEEFSKNGFCVFLNAKNVTKNGFAFDEVQFISQNKDTALSKGKLKRSDVILTTRGSIGHFAIFSKDISYDHMRINSGMVILRPNPNLVSSKYLYSFCKSEIMSSTIASVSFGNAQQQLTVASIKKLPLYYPTSEEQQKIAACLSSLDDLISAQSQKIEALKQHKKGLMQQLFPNSPPLEGWQAQPDGVVSSVVQGSNGVVL